MKSAMTSKTEGHRVVSTDVWVNERRKLLAREREPPLDAVRETGARAMVVSSRANVVRLLRVTGFDRIAPVHPSLDEAIAV